MAETKEAVAHEAVQDAPKACSVCGDKATWSSDGVSADLIGWCNKHVPAGQHVKL